MATPPTLHDAVATELNPRPEELPKTTHPHHTEKNQKAYGVCYTEGSQGAIGCAYQPRRSVQLRAWGKIQATTSFIISLNRSRYPWRQLAGHPDSFVKAKSAKWILKLSSATERAALNAATKDPALRGVVVRFDGTTEVDAEEYLVLRNMLFGNRSPNILDVKLGQRTYNALDAAGHDTPRLDLLHKMIKIDPAEPTKMEQEVGVTKRRYMQYRESRTTSAVYGFRVDAMHVDGGDKDLFSKYIHSDLIESAKECLQLGCRNDMGIRDKIVAELENIDACLRKSHFFMHHEVVGSSILHVISDDGEVNCKLLDFGKTVPSRTTLTHELDVSCLTTRSQEDGYLIGLRALITTWESL